jgi:IS1 family transposase
MDVCGEKTLPREDEYEDNGTWIWISMATESRLVLSHVVGKRSQKTSDHLVKDTANRLRSIPLFVTDGLNFYTKSLQKQYGKLKQFAPTGKRGRPRSPRLIVDNLLKYAQVIKIRAEGKLKKVVKRIIFGENINANMISTSYIERLNLTCRQDNNRISRKTIGFSKKREELKHQMTLYFGYFNYCRPHRSLRYKDDQGRTKLNCPAKQAGLIDHVWSMNELLAFPYHRIQAY